MDGHPNRGVTLIELLVTIAILSMVLAGIYGLLNSAFQSYNHTRAKLESQQTARMVLDYLVYRLREVDGGKSTSKPNQCTDCHRANMDNSTSNNANMPCTQDVSVPQKMPDILAFYKRSFTPLPGIPDVFQRMTGNFIQFKADLLPLHGFNESFTDAPSGTDHNGKWDWVTDVNGNGKYDPGEPELLEDMNNNGQYDYFGEIWTFELRTTVAGPYYQLVESLNFTSLQPRTHKANGKVLYDNSVYAATGYTKVPVAYGITGLKITAAPRLSPAQYPTDSTAAAKARRTVSKACAGSTATACHGSSVTGNGPSYGRPLNVYGNATSMDYGRFIITHPWWNIGGLSVEVTTTDTKGRNQQFTKLREFVNFKNLEINQ